MYGSTRNTQEFQSAACMYDFTLPGVQIVDEDAPRGSLVIVRHNVAPTVGHDNGRVRLDIWLKMTREPGLPVFP